MVKKLLAVRNLCHARGQCFGISNLVFIPAVDSREGKHLPLLVVHCFQPCGLLGQAFHRSGRTPLLPLYALLLFNAPEELTLRTLYELPEFGGGGAQGKKNLQGIPRTVFKLSFYPAFSTRKP